MDSPGVMMRAKGSMSPTSSLELIYKHGFYRNASLFPMTVS